MVKAPSRTMLRLASIGVAIIAVSMVLPAVALAAPAGGGAVMPWTGPLQSLLDNLSGPTARIIVRPSRRQMPTPLRCWRLRS